MSANTVLSFIAGVAVGAVAALLYAPKSGEELRAELAQEARADRVRLQQEYARTVEEVHERLDKVQADVEATLDHVRERAEEVAEAESS